MTRITAEELLKRYAAGERDFAGVVLQDANMRGVNLSGINLSGKMKVKRQRITVEELLRKYAKKYLTR